MTEPAITSENPPAKKDDSAVKGVLVLFAVLAVILTVVIGVALTGDDEQARPTTFTLSGELQLAKSGAFVADTSCTGDDAKGYPDIKRGTQVTVYDASGTVVATGLLGSGTTTAGGPCVFPIAVAGVPGGEDFYRVEVANRGAVTVDAAEAEYGTVSVTLG